MQICPNRNSPEWKMLVSQVGEYMAEITFQKKKSMPNVKSLTELKKDLKWVSKTENFIAIGNRISRYNAKNQTSHRFEKSRLYGNTWELTFIPSYLSVTDEANRLKAARKNDVWKVENLTEESFKNIEPTFSSEPFKHTTLGEEIGKFNEEGNFIPIDDSDELITTATDQLESIQRKQKQRIEKERLNIQQSLINETDINEIKKKTLKLAQLKEAFERADGLLVQAKGVENFEEVLEFADRQLGIADKLVNQLKMTPQDILFVRRVVDLWKVAGDFSKDTHIFLDKDESETPEIKQVFRFKAAKAEDLDKKLFAIEQDLVYDWVQEHSNTPLTREEVFKMLTDSNKVNAMVTNLSRHDDAMLQAIFNAVERANIMAQSEASNIWKDLDFLGQKILKKEGNFDIYQQLNEYGQRTGRMVHRFATEFFTTRNEYIRNAFYKKDNKGNKTSTKADIDKYWQWTKDNTMNFDSRMLFEDSLLENSTIPTKFLFNNTKITQEQKDNHIKELKEQLGEQGYQFYLTQAQKKFEKFVVMREAAYDKIVLEESERSEEENLDLFKNWSKENSPFYNAEMMENPSLRRSADGSTFYSGKESIEYSIQIPRRKVGGKETKWYDKNFEKIEGDVDLLTFHNFMIETLNDLNLVLPSDKKRLMGVGSIPTMNKTLMDLFNEKGIMMGVTPLFDKIKQLQTTTDLSTQVGGDINPLTGQLERDVNIQFVENNRTKINELTTIKKISYEQKTGIIATSEDLKKFKAEATDEIAKQASWDLIKVMKAYSLSVLAYKHQTFINPQVEIASKIFKEREVAQVNGAGKPLIDKNNKILTKQGATNLNSALDFLLDSTHYNVGARKTQGVSKTKLYSKEENTRKKELEELLANTTDEGQQKLLQEQIDRLGGYRTTSGTVDMVLKYNTFLSLGWNIGSAFSNIGFGVISNIIQGSDGRDYSMKNMRNAYMLTMNSIGRNLSFNSFEGIDKVAVKIRTLVDKFDLLQTSNKELFDTSQKSSYSKLKRFGPMSLQERSEYLNYAPVMIAVMMEMKATAIDGKEISLWEAYDITTGTLKEGFTSDIDEVKMIQKIKRIIEMNHGDYNNPLQAKATIEGRILTQFRTWMFEGFKSRFESEKIDQTLSYGKDSPYVRKGRYKSYTQGQLITTGATMGTMFLPGIGTAVGAGVGYLGGKFFGMQTEETTIGDTLFTLKQLLRKLTFQKTQFNEKFTEVDAANMRKNMTELYLLVSIMGAGLLLTSMAGGDNEDEKKKNWKINFLINQASRLSTDIQFYTNPLELEKLTKAAIPATSLLQKTTIFLNDAKNLLDDDLDNDTFQSGPFKGDSKLGVHGRDVIPLLSSGNKFWRQSSQIFE